MRFLKQTLTCLFFTAHALVWAEPARVTTREGTSDGNRGQWTARHQHGDRVAETEGVCERSGNARTWRAETRRTGRDGRERTAVTTGTATRSTSYDGYPVIHRRWTRTRDDGTVITGESETIVVPGENGRTWQTTGSRSGPFGTREFTGSGRSVRTGNGVNWEATREGTGRDGREWISRTQGNRARAGDETQWRSTTVRSHK